MQAKKVSALEASLVLLGMLAVLGCSVIGFGLAPQVPVLTTTALVIFCARWRGFSWDDVNSGIKEGVKVAIIPIFIFILIGALIAVWIQAGVIPAMMVAGFKLLSGEFFVPSVFVVCAIVGLAIGSGFTNISTVGIALLGIGASMHANLALVAGAIVSGAVFGDKMSPLSDSTNLASAVAESELFAHIKNMMWSTLPAFFVSLILFWLLGQSGTIDASGLAKTTRVLQANFHISWWALLPILLMFICAWRKIPAIPTLFINIVVSCVMIFAQGSVSVKKLADLINNGYVAHTSSQEVNQLLTRGGISSMMATVALIVSTLALGGLLIKFKIIQTAMAPIVARLTSPKSLIPATLLAGIGINLFVGEQYLSVILPGRAFKPAYDKIGLDPLALSRTLEDGGSVINYLIPWGVAGSFAASALGVPVLSFLPFAFFSLFSPLFSLLSAWTELGLKWQHKK